MGKVIFDISMSLDGFITGANPRPEAGWGGLGEGGERLHDWGFNSVDPRDRTATDWYANVGANIFGRTGYDHSILNWGADGPSGAARVPTVIVSHSVPGDVPACGVYSFVDRIEAALESAKTLAGARDIYIAGADVARQFLQRGLIDEVFDPYCACAVRQRHPLVRAPGGRTHFARNHRRDPDCRCDPHALPRPEVTVDPFTSLWMTGDMVRAGDC